MEASTSDQPPVKRRHGFQPGISGSPLGPARALRDRVDQLFALIKSDFGVLSATDTILLRQAALLIARSERVRRLCDIGVSARLSSEARRIIASLERKRDRGSKRSESGPQSWDDYLADDEATELAAGAVEASPGARQGAAPNDEPRRPRRRGKRPSTKG